MLLQYYRNKKILSFNDKLFLFFILLLINPWISIFDISLHTFILLLLILINTNIKPAQPLNSNFYNLKSIWFIIIGILFSIILSLILAPKPYVEISFIDNLYTVSQVIIWLIAFYISIIYTHRIGDKLILRTIFYSVILFIIIFYIAKLFDLKTLLLRNTFSYYLVALNPLVFAYLFSKRIKITALLVIGLTTLSVFFVESRTGSLILFFQFVIFFVYTVSQTRITYLSRIVYFVSVVILILGLSVLVQNDKVRTKVGHTIEEFFPRIGNLIVQYDVISENDRSWMIRRAMVQKGLRIFDEYPLTGVGFFRFSSYKVNVESYGKLKTSGNLAVYRSSHNSYIQWLSETGILGFLIFILFLLKWLFIAIRSYIFTHSILSFSVLISTISILIYMYIIAGIYGTFIWSLIGILIGLATLYHRKYV